YLCRSISCRKGRRVDWGIAVASTPLAIGASRFMPWIAQAREPSRSTSWPPGEVRHGSPPKRPQTRKRRRFFTPCQPTLRRREPCDRSMSTGTLRPANELIRSTPTRRSQASSEPKSHCAWCGTIRRTSRGDLTTRLSEFFLFLLQAVERHTWPNQAN